MLNNYLGIVIDPEGNYLTFGKWLKIKEQNNLCYHGRSFLIALKASGWISSHKDFHVTYDCENDLLVMDSDFYALIEEWNESGYVFFLNWSSPSSKGVACFTSNNLSFDQVTTLFYLKPDILWQEDIFSELFLRGTKADFLTLNQMFIQIDKSRKDRKRMLTLSDTL